MCVCVCKRSRREWTIIGDKPTTAPRVPTPGVVTQTETYSQDVNRLSSLANLFKDPTKKSSDRHFMFSCFIYPRLSAVESLYAIAEVLVYTWCNINAKHSIWLNRRTNPSYSVQGNRMSLEIQHKSRLKPCWQAEWPCQKRQNSLHSLFSELKPSYFSRAFLWWKCDGVQGCGKEKGKAWESK